MTEQGKIKGSDLKRAFFDFIIIVLLVAGAGGGGYFWGLHQRLAPVEMVPPGTPGAISQPVVGNLPPPISATGSAKSTSATPTTTVSTTATAAQPGSTSAPPVAAKHQEVAKRKYWISSSGSDYIGYSITVKVNDTPVDNFFGPGKTVDITNLIKHGQNDVTYEAKAIGADYNKHSGDASAVLTVNVVSGPFVQENYKLSDVLATYKRNATDSGDASDVAHFNGD